jgi:glycosyltransferase involved in cell wall biosynthesis
MAGIHGLKSEFQPDVVHLNFPSPSCMFHLLTEKAWRAPTIAAIHSAFPPQARTLETLTRRMLGASAWVTANSQATLRDALSFAPEITQRASVVYNGLPGPQCEPSPLSFDPPVIACVARLVEGKGIDIALRALAIARRRIPGVKMLIAGDGPEADKLHALAHEIEVSDSVEFMGWVDPAAIAKVIDSATLVLVPSRHAESFGIVAVEAMQMARPVIVTDRGGLPEVVDDGETGFVVPADDADALAQAASRILENPPLARKLGEAGKTRAEKCFGIERCTDEHEALYRRLASGSFRNR